MSRVTFSDDLEEHIVIPWENRTNFDMLDVIRHRILVNKMWIDIIKQIKQQQWRLEHPEDKKRLKDNVLSIIKEDTSP